MQNRATFILLVATIAAIAAPIAFDQVVSADTVTSRFSDGTHLVGSDITPGTYVTDIGSTVCSVTITSTYNQTRRPTFLSRAIVTITEQDASIETSGCGEWSPHTAIGQKHRATQFGEGTYHVGVDILPGIYTADTSDGRCLWFTIKDFTHTTDPNQVLTWWKVGQPVVELTTDDVGFYSIRCGTWVLREDEQPEEPLTEFGDGSFLVNIDIAPGNYVADPGDERCNWFRTAPFGDQTPDNTGGYASQGHQVITILATDTGFFSEQCGTWRSLSTFDAQHGPAHTIGQGTYIVGIDVNPGDYVADAIDGRYCRWFLLRGFAGRASDIISSGTGVLRGIAQIPPDAVGFRSINCGDWHLIDNLQTKTIPDTFGDGEHIVNVHITPGIYTSPGPETGRCAWRRLKGFGGSGADHVAVRNPVGRNIAEIAANDAAFVTFGCGEWKSFDSSGEDAVLTSFGRGTWAVSEEIEPGTYAADVPIGSTCFWSRLSSFSGEPMAFVATESAILHSVMTINDLDEGFYSDGCGVWNFVSYEPNNDGARFSETFEDGVYITNLDVGSGTYISSGIEGRVCYWSRMAGFDGDSFQPITTYASAGQAIATILDTDAGFRSFGCGSWRILSESITTSGRSNESDYMSNSDERPMSRFVDGTYRVSIDIEPGRYITTNASPATCYWRRIKDFTWTSGVVVETRASGIKIVDIADDDLGFASAGCGEWTRSDLETAEATTPQLRRFSNGSYIVGLHIEPGTYIAFPPAGGRCRWRRVKGFGGTDSDTISQGEADVRWMVAIDPDDAGFMTHGCGVWHNVDNLTNRTKSVAFGDGSHEVNVDIEPGIYVANVTTHPYVGGQATSLCKWQRVAGFGHTPNDLIEMGTGRGRIKVNVTEDDFGFVSQGCGRWQKSNGSIHLGN